jgi:hypothetical protein
MNELEEATRLVRFVFPGAFDRRWQVAIHEEGVFYLPNPAGEWRLLTYAEINAAITKEIARVWDVKITDYKYHDKNCTPDQCALEEGSCPKSPLGNIAPVTKTELDNELGNHIKITIEGPASTSENILTIDEAKALRDSLNEHLGDR